MPKWAFIENICILAAICFLCWALNSGWPCLLMMWCNFPSNPKPTEPSVEEGK